MGKRLKIGLIFSYDPNWVAGAYYVVNLIETLKLLPDSEKPELTIISSNDDFKKLNLSGYSYVNHFEFLLIHSTSLPKRIINKICRFVSKKNIFELRHYYVKVGKLKVDVIFPVSYGSELFISQLKPGIKLIYWIPDFQDKYFPEFFNEDELLYRREFYKKICISKENLILSSNSAFNDFIRFFPDSDVKPHIFFFSVVHPPYELLSRDSIYRQYNLPPKYFFTPNQFWQHKNHLVILHALNYLKDKIKDLVVVFSGKAFDNRNENYFEELKKYIEDNGLEANVRLLGFIKREEQLFIQANALAVIQPSLFEGWSTVVEDCKAQNQFVLLSDLKVHREQMKRNVHFFDPLDENALAVIMENY